MVHLIMARKNRNRNKPINKETTMTENTTENTNDITDGADIETVETTTSEVNSTQVEEAVVNTTDTEIVKEVNEPQEAEIEQSIPEHLSELNNMLKTYTEDMKPRVPVNNDAGAAKNYTLWKTLEDIINLEDNTLFKEKYKLVNKYFNDYKDGAFGPIYLFRFSEYWRWSTDELDAFHRLLNIIVLTCDPTKRQEGLKQVDLNKALSEGFTEQARQNITNFLLG